MAEQKAVLEHLDFLDNPEFLLNTTPEQKRFILEEASDSFRYELDEATKDAVVQELEEKARGSWRKELSTKQKVINTMRTVATAAPEMAGSITGGIFGGIVGSALPGGTVPGAIVGSGVGGGLGKGAEITLRTMFPKIFVNPDPYAEQHPVREIATATALDAGAEGLGRAVPPVIGALKRKVSPELVRRIGILDREKIPYTYGDVKPRTFTGWLQNVTGGTLTGGGKIAAHEEQQALRLLAFRERILNSMGQLVDPVQLGKDLKKAVETQYESLFAKGGFFEKSYQALDNLYKVKVNPKQIRDEVQLIYERVADLVKKNPSLSPPESPSRFLTMLNSYRKYGQQTVPVPGQFMTAAGTAGPGATTKVVDIPMTFQDLWNSRQMIDQQIRALGDDGLRDEAKGTLKELHNIFDRAMEDAAKGNPKLMKQLRDLNGAYRTAKGLYETESMVKELATTDPEDVIRKYFGPGQVTPAEDLFRALSPVDQVKYAPQIQRQVTETLLRDIEREIDEVPVVSGTILTKRLKTRIENLKAVFATAPDKLQSLRDFADAAQAAFKSKSVVNPQSGGQHMRYGQISLIAGGAAAGIGGIIGIVDPKVAGASAGLAGMTIIGPNVLARMLLNPKVTKLLIQGFNMSSTAARATGWTPRILNMVRMYEQAEKDSEKERQQRFDPLGVR